MNTLEFSLLVCLFFYLQAIMLERLKNRKNRQGSRYRGGRAGGISATGGSVSGGNGLGAGVTSEPWNKMLCFIRLQTLQRCDMLVTHHHVKCEDKTLDTNRCKSYQVTWLTARILLGLTVCRWLRPERSCTPPPHLLLWASSLANYRRRRGDRGGGGCRTHHDGLVWLIKIIRLGRNKGKWWGAAERGEAAIVFLICRWWPRSPPPLRVMRRRRRQRLQGSFIFVHTLMRWAGQERGERAPRRTLILHLLPSAAADWKDRRGGADLPNKRLAKHWCREFGGGE